MTHSYYYIAAAGFIILSLICLYYFFKGLRIALGRSTFSAEKQGKIWRGSLIGVSLWVIVISIVSFSKILYDFSTFPPKMMIVLFIPLVTVIFLTFRKDTQHLLDQIPPHWLMYFQVFRVPVEIILWVMFMGSLIPVQMTFEGRNFDILVGITGPIFGYLCFQKGNYRKTLAIIWNIAGLLLLINILVIAVLSMPTPMRYFMNEPANTIVATFPFVWLPAILVALAYTSHIFSLRQLTQLKP